MKIDLKLEESSKRFPENVLVTFRVPEFSQLINSTYTSLQVDPGYTEPIEVTQTGLHFLVRHTDQSQRATVSSEM